MLSVIYDGGCGICHWLRLVAERRDTHGRLHFAAYQTADLDALAPGLTRAEASRALIVVRPDGRRYRGARAVFLTMRALPFPWRVIGAIGALPPVSWLFEPFYRLIARHRARISVWVGLAACRVDPPKVTSENSANTKRKT